MLDGAIAIEDALIKAVESRKDFYQFAGVVRSVALSLGYSDDERDIIFGALAKGIDEWKEDKVNLE